MQRKYPGEKLPGDGYIRDGGGEKTVPGGVKWTSGTEISFCDKCGRPYRRADYLAAHISMCKGEGRSRQVVNRAALIAHYMIGSKEAMCRSVDASPYLDGITVCDAVRETYELQPG